jgi:hypothetical protein
VKEINKVPIKDSKIGGWVINDNMD